MTQIVVDLGILPAEKRRHAIDDVTTRRRTTSGQRDTAFQSIEKRFRADLSRRLRDLRARLERSRGRPVSGPPGPGAMPTIAARPSTGAWSIPRPPRRRCVSYQSVARAVNPLTIPSTRTWSSSVLLGSRRNPTGLADSRNSLSDDPLTSPEVAGSRDSVTSWTSDLSAVFGASERTVFDSSLTTTDVCDVVGNYSKLDKPETAQRISNTGIYGDDVEEPAGFDGLPSNCRDTVSSSHCKASSIPVVPSEIGEELDQRFEALQRQFSAALDSRPTSTSGSLSPLRVPDVTRRGTEIAASASRNYGVDVVSALSSSRTVTGKRLEKRRRSVREARTMASEVYRRSETVLGDGDSVLQPPLSRGQSTSPHLYTTYSHVVSK